MKTYRYITLAAMALTFAACSQDEDFAPQTDGDAVKINATIGAMPQTRLAYDEVGNTTFASGDKIRVINYTRSGKSKSDAVYQLGDWDNAVATEDTWEPATDDNYVVWNGTESNTIYGVYPSTAEYAKFTIPTDQSTDITAADWMTDSYIGTRPANKTLNLAFKHLLTKVTVNVTIWNTEYDSKAQTIKDAKIHSLATGIKKNDDGAAEANQTQLTGITPLVDGSSYTAIICPGKYTSDQKIMTFTVNDEVNEHTVRADNNTTLITGGLQPGYHYTFSLTVGKEAATISSVTVTIWDQKDVEGGVADEIIL